MNYDPATVMADLMIAKGFFTEHTGDTPLFIGELPLQIDNSLVGGIYHNGDEIIDKYTTGHSLVYNNIQLVIYSNEYAKGVKLLNAITDDLELICNMIVLEDNGAKTLIKTIDTEVPATYIGRENDYNKFYGFYCTFVTIMEDIND